MEGYRVPPVMFTDTEANALVTAEQLVLKSKDASLKQAYSMAIEKIRAVLRYATKDKVELLADRIAMSPAAQQPPATNSLMMIQNALTSCRVMSIVYQPAGSAMPEKRTVEPFAFYYSEEENWLLIAYCRLRKDYRMFRLDRITELTVLDETFKQHKLTLAEYLAEKRKKFTHP
jgi:predicted DNA-binding transcriptional regulator YafY